MTDLIEIRPIDAGHKADINIPNEPFLLFGRIVPTYDGREWHIRFAALRPRALERCVFRTKTTTTIG